MAKTPAVPTSAPTDTNPANIDQITALWSVLESLRDVAVDTYVEFESDTNLPALVTALGYIRDRADSIQNAVIGILEALRTHL